MRRRGNERNVCFPEALREQIQHEWKARGYRSEQQFILDACRHEVERSHGDENGSLEQRLASSISRLSFEIREARRDINASHAFQSAFVKYSLACQVEPIPTAVQGARSRALQRYREIVESAGLEMRESGLLDEIRETSQVSGGGEDQTEENDL
jgi:hypothetical protein